MNRKTGIFIGLGQLLIFEAYVRAADVGDVIIGSGKDGTEDLQIINNIFSTVQSVLLYGIGPLLGTTLVLKGFKLVGQAERSEKGPGVTMIVMGACCFIIAPLISQLIKAVE